MQINCLVSVWWGTVAVNGLMMDKKGHANVIFHHCVSTLSVSRNMQQQLEEVSNTENSPLPFYLFWRYESLLPKKGGGQAMSGWVITRAVARAFWGLVYRFERPKNVPKKFRESKNSKSVIGLEIYFCASDTFQQLLNPLKLPHCIWKITLA